VTGVGAVVIGRNEAARLPRCLASVRRGTAPVVFVDSGSSDGSAACARALGATVVELDASMPFTAARARNVGFARLMELAPAIELVQFVDGDCELDAGWISAAAAALDAEPAVAAVAGRMRERTPSRSPFHRLRELEWDVPPGEVPAFGGPAMLRAAAFRAVGGFAPTFVAGEEAELCVRLRARGWKILRLAAPMAVHDAGALGVGAWWRRTVRTGYGYAHGAARWGRSAERLGLRESASIWGWGLGVPLAALAATWMEGVRGLAVLAALPALGGRVYRRTRRRGVSRGDAALYAVACVLGKLPQLVGQVRFWMRARP
jgi:GT2 family glycosyltransferase